MARTRSALSDVRDLAKVAESLGRCSAILDSMARRDQSYVSASEGLANLRQEIADRLTSVLGPSVYPLAKV